MWEEVGHAEGCAGFWAGVLAGQGAVEGRGKEGR